MLSLLLVLAVAAVLFVAASVATLDRDLLVDAPPDRADVVLPDGHLYATDVAAVRFGMTVRGYRMEEVDEVLERLQVELDERDDRTAKLQRALAEIVEPAVVQAELAQEQPQRVHHPVGWPG